MRKDIEALREYAQRLGLPPDPEFYPSIKDLMGDELIQGGLTLGELRHMLECAANDLGERARLTVGPTGEHKGSSARRESLTRIAAAAAKLDAAVKGLGPHDFETLLPLIKALSLHRLPELRAAALVAHDAVPHNERAPAGLPSVQAAVNAALERRGLKVRTNNGARAVKVTERIGDAVSASGRQDRAANAIKAGRAGR